jgi:protein SCO1/2
MLPFLLIPLLCTAGGESRLALIRTPADFELTAQDDKPVRLSDLKGRVVLVGFVFTTCNGSCPVTTHRMAAVQDRLKARKLGGDKVRLVSVTLDPARDTPEALRRYARAYDADPQVWSFLTGPPERVRKVIDDWGMWVKPAANGQLDHPSRVFLLDKAGRVREIYNLDFLKPDWVAEDIELLLGEPGE